jgi:tripartite-type tricarboxylate transporter receptor subunit TctC
MLRRRTLLVAAPALLPVSTTTAQTSLPDETLDILVGFQAAGGLDMLARRIAARLEARLGRRVTVDNKPGASGAFAGDVLTRQPADGTALALLASTSLLTRLTRRDFPFDPVNDLAPVTLLGTWPIGLAVSPASRIDTFKSYLAWLKASDDGRRKIGNTASDVFVEAFDRLLDKELGVNLQPVHYPGASAMTNDLADGRLPAAVSGVVSLLAHHRGRRLRLLMTTGPERLAIAPDIPTAREVGVGGLQTMEWFGFFARAGTPQPLIDEWNRQLVAVMNNPAAVDELAQLGLQVALSTPQELGARLVNHLTEWRARMTAVGLTPVN